MRKNFRRADTCSYTTCTFPDIREIRYNIKTLSDLYAINDLYFEHMWFIDGQNVMYGT